MCTYRALVVRLRYVVYIPTGVIQTIVLYDCRQPGFTIFFLNEGYY